VKQKTFKYKEQGQIFELPISWRYTYLGVDVVIHKRPEGSKRNYPWVASEFSTGLAISSSYTRHECDERVKRCINEYRDFRKDVAEKAQKREGIINTEETA
jgi:hypothetical protein